MKTKIYSLIAAIFLLMSTQVMAQWALVWSDEFNGSSLNTSNWTVETGTGDWGWGNNEQQYYRSNNVSVSSGTLRITAKRESYGGKRYTSGRIKSQGKKSFKYGKIEARIKLPSFMGSWPAFWMLGENISSVSWPRCGEIDVMEHINTESKSHGTAHWSVGGNHASYGGDINVDVTQYHVYSVEWDAQKIRWYVDGVFFHELTITESTLNEFHSNFFLLLNMAIGGEWPGYNIDESKLPATMYVDYVRVYQPGSGSGGDNGGNDNNNSSDEFTFGVIPDSQVLSENSSGGGKLMDMTGWYVGQRDNLNLKFVASLGDMTQWGAHDQWQRVRSAYNLFKNNGLPYAPCMGNHDENISRLNQYFPVSEFQQRGDLGGYYNGIENAYYLHTWGGMDFIIVVIQTHDEYIGYYDWNSINWANGILEQYSNRRAIIVTHDFYHATGRRLVGDLITKHDNVFMAVCGHSCDREVRWTERTPSGKPIQMIMSDYQCDSDGGTGLRYYTFKPSENRVYAYTYNRSSNRYETDASSQFSFSYDMSDNGGGGTGGGSTSASIPGKIEAESYSNMSGIQTEDCSEGTKNVGWIDAGDWMDYKVNVASAGEYDVDIRVAASGSGTERIQIKKGSSVLGIATFTGTGGWQTWKTTSTSVTLSAGEQTIRVYAATSGFNINWLNFEKSDGSGGGTGGGTTQPFTKTLQAEDYDNMSGIKTESCSEGGQNVGWIDADDWMIWDVTLPVSGSYKVEYRVASRYGGGKIQLEKAGGSPVYGSISVPKTYGWQTWRTISHNVNLSSGRQYLGIKALSGGFNINWLRITQNTGFKSGDSFVQEPVTETEVKFYPNPVIDMLKIDGVKEDVVSEVYTLTGTKVLEEKGFELNLEQLSQGIYILKLKTEGNTIIHRFIKQ